MTSLRCLWSPPSTNVLSNLWHSTWGRQQWTQNLRCMTMVTRKAPMHPACWGQNYNTVGLFQPMRELYCHTLFNQQSTSAHRVFTPRSTYNTVIFSVFLSKLCVQIHSQMYMFCIYIFNVLTTNLDTQFGQNIWTKNAAQKDADKSFSASLS